MSKSSRRRYVSFPRGARQEVLCVLRPVEAASDTVTSTLTWLDFSDAERRRALQVVELFALHETRDELGLGAIRDALSNGMFPGISTIQRRARYFLFVPWLFKTAETSSNPLARTRIAELALAQELAAGSDTDGVIGVRAGKDLKQLPSMIYWSGLERWGIRRRRGTREQWARSERAIDIDDVGERIGPTSWWHDNLVPPPPGFPAVASLALAPDEAEYLSERITTKCPGTLLAWLISRRQPWTRTTFVWELPFIAELPSDLRRVVDHAQRFSEVISGAGLLYNLMLAEATDDDDRRAEYTGALVRWREFDWSDWDVSDFWTLTSQLASRHDPSAHVFVTEWIVNASSQNPVTSDHLRTLVREREHRVKRRYARLSYEAARDTWRGAAGVGQLDFRWASAQRQILDIINTEAVQA